jgi:hypothetical protein
MTTPDAKVIADVNDLLAGVAHLRQLLADLQWSGPTTIALIADGDHASQRRVPTRPACGQHTEHAPACRIFKELPGNANPCGLGGMGLGGVGNLGGAPAWLATPPIDGKG